MFFFYWKLENFYIIERKGKQKRRKEEAFHDLFSTTFFMIRLRTSPTNRKKKGDMGSPYLIPLSILASTMYVTEIYRVRGLA